MRADSHYVEQFDSPSAAQIIRVLPIDRIKFDPADKAAVEKTPGHEPLVESIRRHGVLQPILVQHSREGYKLIAGRKRLAAASAAGTNTVPCLVHHVDDEEAQRLAAASNAVVNVAQEPAQMRVPIALAQRSAAELSRSLARIGSCSGLLESAELTQQVLSGIVRVEACRSWCLAHALTILADAATPKLVRTPAKAIGRRVMERCEPERRARTAVVETRASVRDATDIITDAELLAAVLTGAVLAALERCDEGQTDPVTLSIDVKSGALVTFGVTRRSSLGSIPRSTAFADVMLQAADKLAGLLGGRSVPIDGHETVVQIELSLATSN